MVSYFTLTPRTISRSYILSDEYYRNTNILQKWYYNHEIAFVSRLKYYSGWMLGQLSVDSSGLSYNQSTKDNSRWVSLYPIPIEIYWDAKRRVQVRRKMGSELLTYSTGTLELRGGLELLFTINGTIYWAAARHLSVIFFL